MVDEIIKQIYKNRCKKKKELEKLLVFNYMIKKNKENKERIKIMI